MARPWELGGLASRGNLNARLLEQQSRGIPRGPVFNNNPTGVNNGSLQPGSGMNMAPIRGNAYQPPLRGAMTEAGQSLMRSVGTASSPGPMPSPPNFARPIMMNRTGLPLSVANDRTGDATAQAKVGMQALNTNRGILPGSTTFAPSPYQAQANEINQRIARGQQAMAAPLAPTPPNRFFQPQGRDPQDPSSFAVRGIHPGQGNFVDRGGQIQSRIDTSGARNVLAGQPESTNTAMRPLDMPGYTMVGNSMVPNSRLPQPSTANAYNRGLGGMTPNEFRDAQAGNGDPLLMTPQAAGILNAQDRAAANPYNNNGLTSIQQTIANRRFRNYGGASRDAAISRFQTKNGAAVTGRGADINPVNSWDVQATPEQLQQADDFRGGVHFPETSLPYVSADMGQAANSMGRILPWTPQAGVNPAFNPSFRLRPLDTSVFNPVTNPGIRRGFPG
ncbi:hypothetical protein UFOVP142_29 [uncultured Caudovirales phage]|uniref:Uncharacterized protein n=1 Tax=uncultured Caudovirales phage TaxID=2100421 RepID=A0A6J7XN75_9CAUD|nr:hypothetical protein UFOVP142_29 [uncultured Caudovirales phage]